MSDHIDLGREGEDLAMEYLLQKGWTFLDRNYRVQKAEVDLIFRHQDQIIFVEVKARESDYLIDPRLLVSRSKQKQIIKVADFYLKAKELDFPSRFDIIIIVLNKQTRSLEHLPNAFTAIG